jgi:uncharacterized membrane protein YdjX (TVP38/TMEM64 family)
MEVPGPIANADHPRDRSDSSDGRDRPSRKSRLVAFILLVAAAATAFTLFGNKLPAAVEWARGLGGWGPVLVAVIYVPATLLFLPGWILTLGAGYAFGLVKGGIAVWVGANVGAAASFLVGRYVARGWIEDKVAGNPKFQAIDRALGKQGLKIVILTRLSPIFPFNVLNYALGLSRVSFRDYVIGSMVGMVPGTIMYVYLGSAVQNLQELTSGGGQQTIGQYVLYGLGFLATVAVTVIITRTAKRALAEASANPTAA